MLRCTICGSDTELDDAMEGTITRKGKCICVRCWHYQMQDTKPVSRALRQDINREEPT